MAVDFDLETAAAEAAVLLAGTKALGTDGFTAWDFFTADTGLGLDAAATFLDATGFLVNVFETRAAVVFLLKWVLVSLS